MQSSSPVIAMPNNDIIGQICFGYAPQQPCYCYAKTIKTPSMILLKKRERIKRMDQLIRLKATGTPKQFANRMGLSKRRIFQLINEMKEADAPIYYDREHNSYCYEKEVEFVFGFREVNLM